MSDIILVTGSTGLVGMSLLRELNNSKFNNVLHPTHQELNLLDKASLENYLSHHKPDVIINLAAKVGGILANKTNQIEYFTENLMIGVNLYQSAAKIGVKKIINIGAGCGYPLKADEPLKEDNFWDGRPQQESIGYSTAKKIHLLLGELYFDRYGIITNSFIPSNLYGINDNFNLKQAHVVPALIHKFHLAKITNQNEIEVWGDGSAKRDFLYVDDLSNVILKSLEWKKCTVLNVATGFQTTIKDLTELIANKMTYSGKIIWQKNMPSGQSSRKMDVNKLTDILGYWAPVKLEYGLEYSIEWFKKNYNSKSLVRL
jgi:GDP-L-fucose synthase